MTEWMVVAGVVLGLLQLVLLVLLLRSRAGTDPRAHAQELAQQEAQRQELLARLQSSSERVERELRREVQESAREALRARAQAPAPEETASEVAPAPVRRVRAARAGAFFFSAERTRSS